MKYYHFEETVFSIKSHATEKKNQLSNHLKQICIELYLFNNCFVIKIIILQIKIDDLNYLRWWGL